MAEVKGRKWETGRRLSTARLALKMFDGLQGGEHAVAGLAINNITVGYQEVSLH